jgi:cytochrome c553
MATILERAQALLKITWVKWTAIGLGAIVGLALSAYLTLYVASEWRLARSYELPAVALRSTAPASAERGKQLATTFSCSGCHGAAGTAFFDVPWVARLVAPNLSRVAAAYSDEELARVIRFGVRPDGSSTVIMPADGFSAMADDDLNDIIAWIRAMPPVADAETSSSWGLFGRLAILQDGMPISAELPRAEAPPVAHPVTPPLEVGRYLAAVTCNHCHRQEEERHMGPIAVPPLRPMAQSYDLAQFTELLRKGKPIGDRKLGLMEEVAVGSFSHLRDDEIAAIHLYLSSLEAPPQ